MRSKWVTSAGTCERAICARCNPKRCSSSHRERGLGSLSPHACRSVEGVVRDNLCAHYSRGSGHCPVLHWCILLDMGACTGALLHLRVFAEKSPSCPEPAERWGPRNAAALPTFVIYIPGSYIMGFYSSFTPLLWQAALQPSDHWGGSWGVGAGSWASSASHQGCLRVKFLLTLTGRISLPASLSGPSANLLGQLLVCN